MKLESFAVGNLYDGVGIVKFYLSRRYDECTEFAAGADILVKCITWTSFVQSGGLVVDRTLS